jgi:hypothetical protein
MIDILVEVVLGVSSELLHVHFTSNLNILPFYKPKQIDCIIFSFFFVHVIGHGAYFADDVRKSHEYTYADSKDGTRVIFYNKVLLGDQLVLSKADPKLVAAPVKYHSVKGTQFVFTEYIIYRYGQALPYLKIIYKV